MTAPSEFAETLARRLSTAQRQVLHAARLGEVRREPQRATEPVEQGEDLWHHPDRPLPRRVGTQVRGLQRLELLGMQQGQQEGQPWRMVIPTELGRAVLTVLDREGAGRE